MTYYKSVRLDKTSHFDQKTKWRAGRWIYPDSVDESTKGCSHGMHCSQTLLGAVGYQEGPSLYLEVQPDGIVYEAADKVRCRRIKALRWLSPEEVDKLAGFRLWEANHPHDPFSKTEPKNKRWLNYRLQKWDSVGASVRASVGDSVRASVWASVRASVGDSVRASVGDSVGDSVRDSVGDSVGASVRASVGDSVWDSVWDSVGDSVWDSVWASVWAYTGSLFPNIKEWKHTDIKNPWQPLRELWLAGYVPVLINNTWRLVTKDGLVEGIEVNK